MTRLEQSCLLVRQVYSVRGAVLSLADLGVLFASLVERWHDGIGGNTTQQRNAESRSGMNTDESGESGEETEDNSSQQRSNESKKAPLAEQEMSVQLKQMAQQHDQLLAFVVAGLRSAARGEGGDCSWGVLAEILEWGIKGKSL